MSRTLLSRLWGRKAPADDARHDQPAAAPPPRARRIALLGVDGITVQAGEVQVRSFPWHFSGKPSVVGDYDIVVVNLADASQQESIAPYALPKEVSGQTVLDLLNAAGRLVLAGGEAVVIGRPDTYVWARDRMGTHWTSPAEWPGFTQEWDEHAGDQLGGWERDSDFAPFLSKLSGYRYSLRRIRLAESLQPQPAYRDEHLFSTRARPHAPYTIEVRPLAWTRHDTLVASEHLVRPPSGHSGRPGRVIILHPLECPPHDMVSLLLREVYGVPLAHEEAPWLTALRAPGEAPLLTRIERLQKEVTSLERQIGDAQRQCAERREVLKLLTTGEAALEETVRAALRRLGAEVHDPVESNKEDGWITVRLPDATLQGVLEIKSTQRLSFDEGGLKQLMQWKERGRARGKSYKGIFIGNSAYGMPPSERPNPFGSGFKKTAEASGLVALTTAVLLAELTKVEDDGAPVEALWRTLFATNGVYE